VRFTAVEAEVLTPGAAAKARITEMGVQVLVSTAVFIPPTANSAPVIICVT
jgi:hypothetical protein